LSEISNREKKKNPFWNLGTEPRKKLIKPRDEMLGTPTGVQGGERAGKGGQFMGREEVSPPLIGDF